MERMALPDHDQYIFDIQWFLSAIPLLGIGHRLAATAHSAHRRNPEGSQGSQDTHLSQLKNS